MAKKYRIKQKKDGRFYVQEKGWFFWHDTLIATQTNQCLWMFPNYVPASYQHRIQAEERIRWLTL